MGERRGELCRVSCNVCGADDTIPVTVQSGWPVVRCRRCGFVYVNPRPDPSRLPSLYDDYLPSRMADPGSWRRYMERVFRTTAAMIEELAPGRGGVLDVGCGYGYFVEEMARRGWRACGVDLSASAVEAARARGLRVERGSVERLPPGLRGPFDAVTMFYVLEHLHDPLSALEGVRRLLRPGGVLVLRLPHTTPIVRLLDLVGVKNNLYDPPFHLCDFSPSTVRIILEKAGFSVVKTCIGGWTEPLSPGPRLASALSGRLASLLSKATGGRLLLPGVSKTTLALREPS
ncbi:MAG TPA: class I SAM-dependent methyltransferase [Deltaproteobacteria bacterium]|nr:class I SAM-dependent methyltransferase [Deltaproteobacteria bacterium]